MCRESQLHNAHRSGLPCFVEIEGAIRFPEQRDSGVCVVTGIWAFFFDEPRERERESVRE